MKAVITGESERIGVKVQDNNGVDHGIEMDFDGEIKYHEQDGYPDKAAKRTKAGNEHVEQARRYAKYYVLRERGHPTVSLKDIPEWQVVVATAISQLSIEAFESIFGNYHRQLRSVVEPDVDPVVEVPEEDVAGLRVYLLNVHLGIDIETDLTSHERDTLQAVLETQADPEDLIETVAENLSQDALSIAGVSEVGVLYQGETREIEQEGDDPHTGPPDARLELSPTGVPEEDGYLSIEGFQVLLVHHLLCQARDCYLQMGLEPPEPLRVLGLGKYRQTVRNEHLDMYEPVHGTKSPVEGYSLPEVGTHLDSYSA